MGEKKQAAQGSGRAAQGSGRAASPALQGKQGKSPLLGKRELMKKPLVPAIKEVS